MTRYWEDGGALDEILQRSVKDALEWYVQEGYFFFDTKMMTLTFALEENAANKEISLIDLIEEELKAHVPGDEYDVDVLTFQFSEEGGPNVLKLQQCLRILRA